MPKTRHLLGLSGGKDSAALAVFMRENYPDIYMEYFFTDTGKELPEVYSFLGKLEGILGKEIVRLNSDRGFDFWWKQFNTFLPSPRTRWCTKYLKIRPFERWISGYIEAGGKVISYVAIRADEERTGFVSHNPQIEVKFPFAEHDIDKAGVLRILEDSGLGLPDYYSWRSRSGCTFCFFQQKIEWVRLMREHPDKFDEAKKYEKIGLENGSPFTWSQGESLEDLAQPARVKAIEKDFQARVEREKNLRRRNPLIDDSLAAELEIDELYGVDEGAGACLVCHK